MMFQVENGSFCYLRGKNILHDIDFTVRAGEIMAVLGPNPPRYQQKTLYIS